MISDTLHNAIEEIRRYLDDPVHEASYLSTKSRIAALLADMEAVRVGLDTPPGGREKPQPFEVIIRGPQGCGKSTAAEALAQSMAERYRLAATADCLKYTIVIVEDGIARVHHRVPAWRRPFQSAVAPADVLTIRVINT